MSQYPSGWGECSICGERSVFEGRSTCGCKAKPAPPCPNCAKLREALVEASRLATMVANIIGQVDNWCPTTALRCVLNLNGIIKAAVQALAEPGGKP